MAFTHSKLTVFKLDNAAGALQTLSTYISSVDMSVELDEVETTTFGASDRTYLSGFAAGTISLEGFLDPTLNTHMSNLRAGFRSGSIASSSFEYGPQGNDTGQVKHTGELVMTKYEVKNDIGDAASWSAEFRITGAVTDATY